MNKKVELTILSVIGIIIITILGATFAYFAAVANKTGDDIEGETFDFGVSLNIEEIYKATNLVPLSNNLVGTAISKANNKCIDKNGRDVCSLYKITLSNTGNTIALTPSVTTTNSTYTESDIRCQLYNSSFTSVSDIMTPSNTSNAKIYMTNGGNNVSVNMENTDQIFYLVIWLTETNNSQSNDYSKTYNGSIAFEGGNAGEVYAYFAS